MKRTLHAIRRWWPVYSRVYYSLPVLFLLVAGEPVSGQVSLTIDPAMTKGPSTAPVTIVEFTDYQ